MAACSTGADTINIVCFRYEIHYKCRFNKKNQCSCDKYKDVNMFLLYHKTIALLCTALLLTFYNFSSYRSGDNIHDYNTKVSCPGVTDSTTTYFVHETDCSKFYRCLDGVLILLTCPDGFHFDPLRYICDSPDKIECRNTYPINAFQDELNEISVQGTIIPTSFDVPAADTISTSNIEPTSTIILTSTGLPSTTTSTISTDTTTIIPTNTPTIIPTTTDIFPTSTYEPSSTIFTSTSLPITSTGSTISTNTGTTTYEPTTILPTTNYEPTSTFITSTTDLPITSIWTTTTIIPTSTATIIPTTTGFPTTTIISPTTTYEPTSTIITTTSYLPTTTIIPTSTAPIIPTTTCFWTTTILPTTTYEPTSPYSLLQVTCQQLP
ncbi:hypothetical protein NQ314_021305 [Rhamnusium bicolor]|uniref:Chitin-binding type-2 domain-containing protein n=1 Tax=Rhamnusium bicolor TaxID=1586634 RepID=A0AAV8WJS3_9CUCU|nr:hypothetical protein NQ314_021305 [Rhamnusium bicolor]